MYMTSVFVRLEFSHDKTRYYVHDYKIKQGTMYMTSVFVRLEFSHDITRYYDFCIC